MSNIHEESSLQISNTFFSEDVQSSILNRNSEKTKSLYQESRAGFFMKFSGFLAGAAASAAILAKVLTIGAATSAALVTPFGWAALACLGVGVAIIATKHFLDKSQPILESIKSAVIDFGKCCAGTISAAVIIIGCILGGGFLMVGEGGGGSSIDKKKQNNQNAQ
jgi:hypothetical protein